MNKMKSIEKIVDNAVRNAMVEIHRELGFELKYEDLGDHSSLSSKRIGEKADRKDLLIAGAMMVGEAIYLAGVYQRSAANEEYVPEAMEQYKDLVMGLADLTLDRLNSQQAIEVQ